MDRTQKEKMIGSLHETFKSAGLVVVTKQVGLTVAEMSDLRRQMRQASAGFKVAKNRLARRALEGTRYQHLSPLLKGPTALAYSHDPVAAAKVAVEFAGKNDKLTVIGGGLGERSLDPAAVKALATLPSLDQLRGKLVGLLVAPATRIAGVLQAPAGQLARVVNARATKLGEAA